MISITDIIVSVCTACERAVQGACRLCDAGARGKSLIIAPSQNHCKYGFNGCAFMGGYVIGYVSM